MPDTDLQVAALADGAPWIWKLVKRFFPSARQVLDYFHCAEHVHKVANEQYADPSVAAEWTEATLARLSLGQASDVIRGLKRMRSRNASAREKIRKLIGYIDANRKRMAYDDSGLHGRTTGLDARSRLEARSVNLSGRSIVYVAMIRFHSGSPLVEVGQCLSYQ